MNSHCSSVRAGIGLGSMHAHHCCWCISLGYNGTYKGTCYGTCCSTRYGTSYSISGVYVRVMGVNILILRDEHAYSTVNAGPITGKGTTS